MILKVLQNMRQSHKWGVVLPNGQITFLLRNTRKKLQGPLEQSGDTSSPSPMLCYDCPVISHDSVGWLGSAGLFFCSMHGAARDIVQLSSAESSTRLTAFRWLQFSRVCLWLLYGTVAGFQEGVFQKCKDRNYKSSYRLNLGNHTSLLPPSNGQRNRQG